MTDPNQNIEQQIAEIVLTPAHWQYNDYQKAQKALIALIQAQADKARIDEHGWYKKHEIYQLNGQPIMRPPTIRVVKMEDVENRLAALKKEQQ